MVSDIPAGDGNIKKLFYGVPREILNEDFLQIKMIKTELALVMTFMTLQRPPYSEKCIKRDVIALSWTVSEHVKDSRGGGGGVTGLKNDVSFMFSTVM